MKYDLESSMLKILLCFGAWVRNLEKMIETKTEKRWFDVSTFFGESRKTLFFYLTLFYFILILFSDT